MTPPPRPDALSPAEARRLVREVRAELRPQRLDELRRLYAAAPASIASRALILAEEVRLQSLDRYLGSLIPAMEEEGESLGWESFRPSRRRLRWHGAHRLEAEVEMAFSPENHECVHGPSTMVPVVGLAEKLLEAGERVAAIDRITWSTPLRHAVRLSVWSGADPEAVGEEPTAFSGRLRTTEDRSVQFAAMPLPERPLLVQRGYNELSLELVRGQKMAVGADGDSLVMELSAQALATCRHRTRQRPSLRAALLLDLVPIAILNWRRGRPMVACGYRDVPLPETASAAFAAGSRLELRYRADLSHPSSHSDLWIGYYEFRYQPRQRGWSTMVMAEAAAEETILRQLHA